MGRRVWLLCVVAACGRFHFDERDDAGSSGGDAPAMACPTGFVPVSGNAALGTSDFCVMRFEAKAWRDVNGDQVIDVSEVDADGCDDRCAVCDDLCVEAPNWGIADHAATSVPFGEPWRYQDQTTASSSCRNLGAGFDLMSNREWMTIARDAELGGGNWSGGAPGVGRLVEGNTDGSVTAIAVNDVNNEYDGTGNSAAEPAGAGWEQRRTIYLSNGTVIWDMPGNMQEWVDWTLGLPLDGPPTPCTGAEIPAFSCPGFTFDDYNSSTGTYDSTEGVGWVLGGDGNAARRGGQVTDLQFGYAGIYALNMNRFQDMVFPGTGFRCVFRP